MIHDNSTGPSDAANVHTSIIEDIFFRILLLTILAGFHTTFLIIVPVKKMLVAGLCS